MVFTFSSILCSLVVTSLILLFMRYLLNHISTSRFLRPDFLIFMVWFVFLRLIFPFSFLLALWFPYGPVFGSMVNFLRQPWLLNWDGYNVLTFIWVMGALICTMNYRYHYYKEQDETHPLLNGSRQVRVVDLMPWYVGPEFPVHICPKLDAPCVFAVSRKILIPDTKFTEKELEFILLHELTHLYHHDVVYLQIGQVLKIIYWWYPGASWLFSQLNTILEMRADYEVVQGRSDLEVLAYCTLLVDLAKGKYDPTRLIQTMGFTDCNDKMMNLRIRSYVQHVPYKSTKHAWFYFFGIAFLISLCIIFYNSV